MELQLKIGPYRIPIVTGTTTVIFPADFEHVLVLALETQGVVVELLEVESGTRLLMEGVASALRWCSR
jgi:hypothetical protein